MAVIYTPVSGSQITIGGTASTGPFPKYSIERSPNRMGSGSPISNTYTITITGKIITDSSANIAVTGEMQSNLHAKMITKLQTDIALGLAVGRLEIVPYGGMPNAIEFADARLTSVQLPEQDDDSAGALYSDYTFSFEAYEDISNSAASPYAYALQNVEETWELTPDEDYTYSNNSFATANKTYTITHTVSATGRDKYGSGPTFTDSAWSQAMGWVKSRLVNSPAAVILNDAAGNSNFTDYQAALMGDSSSTVAPDLSDMGFYNHIRTPNCDFNGGSYSVTESWKASPNPATIDMEVNTEKDDGGLVSMTLSGTITGLDNKKSIEKTIDRLANAEAMLTILDASAFSICSQYYTEDGNLLNIVRAKSVGRNKGSGTITFSYSYNDSIVSLEGAISTSIQITDDNEYRLNEIIAVIPIIGKDDGPIIQDMDTTNERKRSVQIDAVMGKTLRAAKPATGVALALSYAPTGGYVQSLTENWEPGTGNYSISVEWTY